MSTLPTPNTGSIARSSMVRAEVESVLGSRFASALTPAHREVRETMLTGIAALDTVLRGGVPLGALTELAGPLCSGRTGVAFSIMASAMREGSMCAWVDASDALDPESAAANGVRLEQLLWVRCGVQPDSSPDGEINRQVSSSSRRQESAGQPTGRRGQHPRDEARGMDRAVGELLRQHQVSGRQDRSIGTPGASNRPIGDRLQSTDRSRAQGPTGPFPRVEREEQVSSDRQPKRSQSCSGHARSGQSAVQPAVSPRDQTCGVNVSAKRDVKKPWSRLDQALRAADLLLQAGGFRVLVLDLGSIAPEQVVRIPLATWFRFRAAAEQNRTVLLALTQTSCAKSSAGLAMCFDALEVRSASCAVGIEPNQEEDERARGVLRFPAFHTVDTAKAPAARVAARRGGGLIESVTYQAQIVRQRFAPVSEPPRRSPMATWHLQLFGASDQAG